MGNDDNPFDPKYSLGLLALIGNSTPPKTENALANAASLTPGVSDLVRALTASTPPAGGAVSDLFGSGLSGPFGAAYDLGLLSQPEPTNALASLTGYSPPPAPFGLAGALSPYLSPLNPPPSALGAGALSPFLSPSYPPPAPLYSPPQPKPAAPTVKRKAFFSFHFDDIMRVNNVRNGWKITHPHSELNRSFYDSSLWESKKLEGEEAIKRLIREGVCYTSAVCVLAGSDTWDRRWVRYEIARAIIDGRGLLTVHLNGINHHVTRTPHARGYNPLDFIGVAKMQDNALTPVRYVLYEKRRFVGSGGKSQWGWFRYDDYTYAVPLPKWLNDPLVNHVMPLSTNAAEYDYVADHGSRNIGSWIDAAAKQAGR
jgi:hypothetical protein